MAVTKILRTYRFLDKDPVIDEMRTVVQDEGLFKQLNVVADLASLSRTTVENWFHGDVRRPQNANVMAVFTSLGYERKITKTRKLNVDEELELARAWLKKERERRKKLREAAPAKKRRAIA